MPTANPWLQAEAEKRGLVVNYLYVHADPEKRWADPKMGVVQRAHNFEDGRMVDAKVFADSYAVGARNFSAIQKANANNPAARFTVVDATNVPLKVIDAVPESATKLEPRKLETFALRVAATNKNIAPHVLRGAFMGTGIWQ